jgi:hypothetical protein
MNSNAHSNVQSRLDKTMTTEQFTKVIDAILAGKYSWACVLVLSFAGYNPLHYIPYRTYNRLVKENRPKTSRHRSEIPTHVSNHEPLDPTNDARPRITDLNYLETIDESTPQLSGGDRVLWCSQALSYLRSFGR